MKNTLIILLFFLSLTAFAGNNKADKTNEAKAREWIKNQPLEFIENKGQFTNTDGKPADKVLFKTSFGGCDIYITDKGLSYVFVKFEEAGSPKSEDGREEREDPKLKFRERKEGENKKISYYRLDMNLEGASISKNNIIKENESKQGHSNYFYAHCPEGIYDVKAYSKITIKNIYKGIDWVIYTNSDSKEHPLKYDFVVHPEADYKDIRIKFLNAQCTSLSDNNTKLKIETIAGNIEEGNLFSYIKNEKLKMNNEKLEVKSKYVISNDSIISFEIANYDTTKTLVIDPLVWATYYGGTSYDEFSSICVDSLDNIYITGNSSSTDFPLQQSTGAFWQSINSGNGDVLILKFNSLGVRQWVSYYGGNSLDYGKAICIDNLNNIYITGATSSVDFPCQQLTGAFWQSTKAGQEDIFILKFNNQGVRQWATYYGGNFWDIGNAIGADNQGNIFITGKTNSQNFPCQQLTGAYWQATIGGGMDVFIIKFNNQGIRQWATYYGGAGSDIAHSLCFDSQYNIYITGTAGANFPCQQLIPAYWQANYSGSGDVFIAKFNNVGIRLWATYYGGSNSDIAKSVCVDSQDNLFITGGAVSPDFPTQYLAGSWNQSNFTNISKVFILKFNNQGVRQWATYYNGGNGTDEGNAISIDWQDNIFVTGRTGSTNFPTQQLSAEYWQPALAGIENSFILMFNSQCERKWATYYGSSGIDYGTALAVDHQNSIYSTGCMTNNLAYTIDYGNGAYYDNSWNGSNDGYILKLNICANVKPNAVHSDRSNICIYDNGNITLSATGGVGDSLKWYTGNCGQNYIGNNTPLTIPSPAVTTTYYARWESNCDTSVCESTTVYVYSVLYTQLNPVICQGENYHVGTHIYTISGTYHDSLTTIALCDSIITTNLTVNPTHQTVFNPIICQGEVYNYGTQSYTTTGIYLDTLSTYLGCDSIITINLTVYQVPHDTIVVGFCEGESYTIGLHTYTSTGIYTDTLSSFLGCDSIITTHITAYPFPIVDLGNDKEICEGELIELMVNNIYTSYLWQDGSSDNKYVVKQPGIYWVIVNQNNCYKADTVKFTLCKKPIDIWIPNSFTPTGDGLNEIFKIETIGEISKFEMLIFNRWGGLIFKNENPNTGWDGKYLGKEVQSGVYTYRIYIKDGNNNQEKVYNGRVTLIR